MLAQHGLDFDTVTMIHQAIQTDHPTFHSESVPSVELWNNVMKEVKDCHYAGLLWFEVED